jgi:hypothetical protein
LHVRKLLPKPNGAELNKSDASRILARRLGLSLGRANALLVAASDAGMLPKARGRDVPRLSALDLAHVLIACICDRGIGVAGQSVREFAALQSAEGAVLGDLVEGMIAGHVPVAGLQSFVVQLEPAGVSVATAGHHFRFGADHAGGAAKQVVIRGNDLAAAILEMRGCAPREADEQVAVAKLAAALH